MDRNPKTGKVVFLQNYKESLIYLSDETIMRVAVCTDCFSLIDETGGGDIVRANIVKNHKNFWASGIDKDNRFNAKQKLDQHKKIDSLEDIIISKDKKKISNLIKQLT